MFGISKVPGSLGKVAVMEMFLKITLSADLTRFPQVLLFSVSQAIKPHTLNPAVTSLE